MTKTTISSPAATLWAAVEAARDLEAHAALDLGAAFAGLAHVGPALAAWTEARALLELAEAALWSQGGAGAAGMAMLAA